MTIVDAFILGAVQGLTEFLPVSSSGHLVLFQVLFGLKEGMLAFDVAVHWATLAAVFVYFRKDFFEMFQQAVSGKFRPIVLIAVASVPTAVIGIVFKDYFESLFGSLKAAGTGWLLTAAFLIASDRFQQGSRALERMRVRDALWVGVAQGISIVPSISRSGATILAAMLTGIEKKDAVRFSFWIGVPAILGAGLLEMKAGIRLASSHPEVFWAGFVTSGILGYFTIAWLLAIVSRGKFYLFGYYCLALGILTLALSWGRP